MPYKRRYRKKSSFRKKTIRRKKYYRRRRPSGKAPTDTMRRCLDIIVPTTCDQTGGSRLIVNWAGTFAEQGNSNGIQFRSFTESPEWASLAAVFREYKITYCKIQHKISSIQSSTNVAFHDMSECSFTNEISAVNGTISQFVA